MVQQRSTIATFCCYARKDEAFLKELNTHLSSLQRRSMIHVWHDGDISAGTEWAREITIHLNDANVILLLISSDFIHSNYCYSTEMQHALERHERGEARVIPIILRHVSGWKAIPPGDIQLGHLQALPKDALPVTDWADRDRAWEDVVQGIERVIEELLPPPAETPEVVSPPEKMDSPPLQPTSPVSPITSQPVSPASSPVALQSGEISTPPDDPTSSNGSVDSSGAPPPEPPRPPTKPPLQPANTIWRKRIQIVVGIIIVLIGVGGVFAFSIFRSPAQPTLGSTPSIQFTPAKTLTTFCTDMLVHNQTGPNLFAAKPLFTAHGWQRFQPPGDSPRNGYTKCTPGPVTILTDKTAQGHLTATTFGNNQTYGIDVTFLLEGNSWKIDSWVSSS